MKTKPLIGKISLAEMLSTQPAADGTITFKVNVTPRSSKNVLVEITDQTQDKTRKVFQLKVKIRGIPVKNEVNENLLHFLAKQLRIGVSELQLISGHKSRQKTLLIKQNALSKQ